jgi:hypothetical protein
MALTDLESGAKANAYRVRQHLEEIEAAIQRRVPIKAIHEELCKSHGLTLTLEAFRTTLKRAREAKKKEATPGDKQVAEARVEVASRATVQIDDSAHNRSAAANKRRAAGKQELLREVMGKDTNPDPGGFIDV